MHEKRITLRRALVTGAVLATVATAAAPAASAEQGTGTGGAPVVTAVRLAAPDGSLAMSSPSDVNRRGEVVGAGRAADGSFRAVRWDGDELTTATPLEPGGTAIYRAINDRGQIAGESIGADGVRRLVLWSAAGTPSELTAASPGLAVDLNNRGQVIASTAAGYLLYGNGTAQPIVAPTPPDIPSESYAERLNNRGQVLGSVNTSGRKGFVWHNGTGVDVDSPAGAWDTEVRGINDRGQVAAQAAVDGVGTVPYLWRNGTITPLAGLPGSDSCWISSYDQVLNARGDVAGSCTVPGGGYHGVLWRHGQAVDLGAFGGNTTTTAVNGSGEVTGVAIEPSGERHAFLWRDGELVDLGIPAGYVASQGRFVTEDGEVVGVATRADGGLDAFVWTVE